MATTGEIVYVGIHGYIVALNRANGEELWRVELKGSDFVNLTLDGDRILATTKGEIFCVDALTGAERWHNKLTGMGLGLATVITAASPGASIGPQADARHRQEQAAASAH